MKRFCQKIAGIIIITLLLTELMGCAGNTLPDNAHDLLSIAYSEMTDLKSYSVTTQLKLTLNYTQETREISVRSKTAAHNEPFEVITEHIMCNQGKEESPTYTYLFEKDEKIYQCEYENQEWKKEEVDDTRKELVASPIEFGTYFIDIDSFEIITEEEGAIVLEGRILKDNIEQALIQTGVLKQFLLTSFPIEKVEEIPDIKVRAWIAKDTVTINKVEIDMKETVQALINSLFGEGSVTGSKVESCIFIIDQVLRNKVEAITLTSEVTKGLEAIRN